MPYIELLQKRQQCYSVCVPLTTKMSLCLQMGEYFVATTSLPLNQRTPARFC